MTMRLSTRTTSPSPTLDRRTIAGRTGSRVSRNASTFAQAPWSNRSLASPRRTTAELFGSFAAA